VTNDDQIKRLESMRQQKEDTCNELKRIGQSDSWAYSNHLGQKIGLAIAINVMKGKV